MEFYKLYTDWSSHGKFLTGSSIKDFNADIRNNPQWKGEVINQTTTSRAADGILITVLVRWVGLSTTPFDEGDKE